MIIDDFGLELAVREISGKPPKIIAWVYVNGDPIIKATGPTTEIVYLKMIQKLVRWKLED